MSDVGGVKRFSEALVFARLRWFVLTALCFWVWCYWSTWGTSTFLRLCDIAVILTCIGIFLRNSLLISSQAVSSIVISMVWDCDVAGRLIFGQSLVGGTEYMWDRRFSLFVRLLSLFHLLLPVLQVWALSRVGYDRRAFRLQFFIAATVLIASTFVSRDLNVNFTQRVPVWDISLGPAVIHVLTVFTGLAVFAYWPIHRLLLFFEPPEFGSIGTLAKTGIQAENVVRFDSD